MHINIAGSRWKLCFSFYSTMDCVCCSDPFACLCVWVCISVCVCVKGLLIVVLYKPFAAECICFHGYPHANVDHVITRPDLCSYCLLIVEEKTECVFGF